MEGALMEMRDFLWEHVYDNPTVHEEFDKCHKMLEGFFHRFLDEPAVFRRVTGQPVPRMRAERMRAVCDFLAGMTDRFATRLFEELFLPRPWPVEP
jgi:dGTPase